MDHEAEQRIRRLKADIDILRNEYKSLSIMFGVLVFFFCIGVGSQFGETAIGIMFVVGILLAAWIHNHMEKVVDSLSE